MEKNNVASAILAQLKNSGVRISIENNNLKLASAQREIDRALIQSVHINKDILLDYLRAVKTTTADLSIRRMSRKTEYATTPSQRRLYFLWNYDRDSVAYNMPQFFSITSSLDPVRLATAFKKLVARHDSLRTSFLQVGATVVQTISENCEFNVEFIESERSRIDTVIKEFVRPFDLSNGPLLRARVVSSQDPSQDSEWLLMVDMHHIICDGISQEIFFQEFCEYYHDHALPPLAIQFQDYAECLQQFQLSNPDRQSKQYWLREFETLPPALELPAHNPRPLHKRNVGEIFIFSLSKTDTKALKRLAAAENGTLFMMLFAIYALTLHKFSNQADMVIGTPLSGRTDPTLETLIGMFVNVLPIRAQIKSGDTFINLFRQVRERFVDCIAHQDYPYEDLIETLKVERNPGRNPLFDVMFAFQNQQPAKLSLGDLNVKYQGKEKNTSKFDLLLSGTEVNGALQFALEFDTDLFQRKTAEDFAHAFQSLTGQILAAPEAKISNFQALSESSRSDILRLGQGVTVDINNDLTIHRMFEAVVQANPLATALTHHENTMTYSALNNRANQMAELLRSRGVGPNDVVGVMTERSFEMIISLLAILKAGAAYLPLDPNYPHERLRYMIANSGCGTVIVDNNTSQLNIDVHQINVLNINTIGFNESIIHDLKLLSKQSDLLYVIYTSGSTGNPKGVMLTNKNLVNLLHFYHHHTNIDFSSVLQFTTLSFDVSFTEIFGTLLAGGNLCLVDREQVLFLPSLLQVIERFNLRSIFMPASVLNQIFNVPEFRKQLPKCLKHIVTAGEQIIVGEILKAYLTENKVYLHNHYGPSETHVVTTETMSPWEEIATRPLIGKPIQNTHIYILDSELNLVPKGVIGELYVGGMQVGAGYRFNAELTAEKFIPNPFKSGDTLYRTGDIGRWVPNGSIEYLGRGDQQVKIRGHRVEVGEIESALLSLDLVLEAAVTVVQQGDLKSLAAYYTSKHELPAATVRDHLSSSLPAFMVPTYFVQLNAMPLTPSGKLDRRRLPVPSISSVIEFVAPENQLESTIAEIWATALNVSPDALSADANFFHVGGHSLNAMAIVNQISATCKVAISLRDFFANPTIRAVAKFLEGKQSPLTPVRPHTHKRVVI
jgi:amino acid adenylation domain-containing protein